jgi:hypothetical protein
MCRTQHKFGKAAVLRAFGVASPKVGTEPKPFRHDGGNCTFIHCSSNAVRIDELQALDTMRLIVDWEGAGETLR